MGGQVAMVVVATHTHTTKKLFFFFVFLDLWGNQTSFSSLIDAPAVSISFIFGEQEVGRGGEEGDLFGTCVRRTLVGGRERGGQLQMEVLVVVGTSAFAKHRFQSAGGGGERCIHYLFVLSLNLGGRRPLNNSLIGRRTQPPTVV